MAKKILIIPSGTPATTKVGKIPGIITACSIRGCRVLYEFSYFNNGEYKQPWMDENEFVIDEVEKQKIGYK